MDFSKYGYKHKASCESCEFYEYDEYTDSYSCNLNLDEDDMGDFLGGVTRECPCYNITTNIRAYISRYKKGLLHSRLHRKRAKMSMKNAATSLKILYF